MRRCRTIIIVLLILVIGLVAVFFAARTLLGGSGGAQQEQATFIEVYVAGQNIPQGGKITEELLTTISIPADKVVAVMFTKDRLPALINKVAKFPLDQGVVITESMVSDSSAAIAISGPQWAALIPPGMTAMSIPASRLSLSAYAINDGAHVNVNACMLFVDVDPSFQTVTPNLTASLTGTGFIPDTLPVLTLGVGAASSAQGRLELDPSLQQPYYLLPSEPQRPRMVCQTLLQDIVVMKLGNFSLNPTTAAQPADPAAAQQPASTTPPDLVTLIVSPQDSITLSYLIYTNAQITMTLRNPSDQSRQPTEASTLQFLLSQYNIPIPAKLPYSMQPAPSELIPPFLPNDAPPTPAQ